MTPIIDAHLHLWDRDRFAYPWMANLPSLPRTSRPERLETEASAAIVVEAGITEGQALAEVEWLTQLAGESPLIRGIVAAVDFTDPHLAEVLGGLRDHPLVVGVRDNFEGRAAGDLAVGASATAEILLAGAMSALDADLTVDLCVRAAQLAELEVFLAALEDASGAVGGVVIDHLGKPLPDDPAFPHGDWVAAMTALADHPGLHVKFSGLPGQVPGEVSAEAARDLAAEFAGEAIAAFGPARTMYGSDHPVSTTGHGLAVRSWEEAAVAALEDVLDAAGTAAVMGGTATDFYLSRRRG